MYLVGAAPDVSAHAVEVVRTGLYLSEVATGGPRALWVAQSYKPRIGRLDGSGRLRWFTRGLDGAGGITGLVSADGGGAWFAGATGEIGLIRPDGSVSSWPTPGSGEITTIARGARGSLWFRRDDVVGRLRDGRLTAFATPDAKPGGQIMRGPDGEMWFVPDQGGPLVYEVDEQGRLTERTLPQHSFVEASAIGPGGRLYIAFFDGSLVVLGPGRAVHTISLGSRRDQIGGLAFGPDGHLWVSMRGSDRLLRLTPDGRNAKRYGPGRRPDAGPYGLDPGAIAPGPHNSMWFLAQGGHAVARITLRARDCAVPELAGATRAGAARRARRAGCALRAGVRRGGWVVRSQRPARGRVLRPGATITARFGPLPAPACVFPRASAILARGPLAAVATRIRKLDGFGDTEQRWWGCVRAAPRLVPLYRSDDSDPYAGEDTLDAFRVAGTFAVSTRTLTDHYGGGSGSLVVWNLRTGRSSDTPVISYTGFGDPPNLVLDDYAVGPQGDLLWLIHAPPPASDTTAVLLLRTSNGISPLAQAPAGAITGLRVDDAAASWSDSDQPRRYAIG